MPIGQPRQASHAASTSVDINDVEKLSKSIKGYLIMNPHSGCACLVAQKKARLRLVAASMTEQGREGDLAAMADEHEEFAFLRQRANGETLD